MKGLVGLFVFLLIVAAYLLPLIVAGVRKVPNVGSVAVVNILLGWTFIGWVVALAMACRSADRNVLVVNQVATSSAGHPGWFPDPGVRHELRYYDGMRWTAHVSDRGVNAVDPPPGG